MWVAGRVPGFIYRGYWSFSAEIVFVKGVCYAGMMFYCYACSYCIFYWYWFGSCFGCFCRFVDGCCCVGGTRGACCEEPLCCYGACY